MGSKRKRQAGGGRWAASAFKALLLDVLLIAVGLTVFALFHHVLPGAGILVVNEKTQSEVDPDIIGDLEGLNLRAGNAGAPFATGSPEPAITPAPEDTGASATGMPAEPTIAPVADTEGGAEPTASPTPAPVASPTPAPVASPTPGPTLLPPPTAAPASGDFGERFESLGLATEEIISAEGKYLSKDVYVRISENDTGRLTFYVADIWIRNIENLRTVFAKDTYGKGYREYAWDMCIDNGGIVAVNGDYYGARDDGVVIRNGELYRDTLYEDVCVLYRDGEMATFSAKEFDLEAAMERGVWQAWSFGPALLGSDGEALTEFQSAVVNRNPRCGIGYYAPGHYCFVVVDGRSEESKGVTLAEFSMIFEQLGCATAYNMDGGNTASMTYRKRVVNQPSQGGRPVTDIIMIAEVDGE